MKTLYKDGKPVVLNGQVLQVNAEGGTDLSLDITGAAVGQIAKISAVDENGKPTAWETIDGYTGQVTADKLQSPDHPTDLVQYTAFQAAVPMVQQLGITGAASGKIPQIDTVDSGGRPTKWKAVDMPSGGGGGTIQWFEVADITTTEQLNTITVNTDADGDPFSAYHAVAMAIALSIPADSTQTSANGSVQFFCANTTEPNCRAILTFTSWKTTARALTIGAFGAKSTTFFAGAVSTGAKTNLNFDAEVFDAARAYIQAAGDHFPIGTQFKVYLLSGGKA